ncbi:uncharacterized protein LOC110091837 isoform X1 [Dendrobium catenatum]|uniref:uncharacterized protein LOC110091837 isoform X1 n=1 Tax=Dendrobium catenatum TaxID=906689 RepID=UPI0009F48ED5|nr:uncharacterized protein LOC110091837 isoform X1 [Dendrobium catenatum]
MNPRGRPNPRFSMGFHSLHVISHGFSLPSHYFAWILPPFMLFWSSIVRVFLPSLHFSHGIRANGLHCRLKNDPRIVGGKEEKNKSELQDAADAASDSDERKQAESNNQTPSEAVYCSGRIRPTLSFRSGTESEGPTAPQTLNPEA